MCGGKKEPEKKADDAPLPEAPPEAAAPLPAEEAPPPAEEPKGAGSAAKGSMMGSESKLAANTKSLALMTTCKGGPGGNFAKGGTTGQLRIESMMGDKNAASLALTSVRGKEPKGAKSQVYTKSTVKK